MLFVTTYRITSCFSFWVFLPFETFELCFEKSPLQGQKLEMFEFLVFFRVFQKTFPAKKRSLQKSVANSWVLRLERFG